MTGWVRPARPLAPIAVSVAILGLWWLVAHNGGAGWVQALGDVAFGTLSVGLFGPSLFLAFSRVRVVSAPTDGIAGLPLEVMLDASSRLRIRAVDPIGDEVFVGPARGRTRSPDERMTLRPNRRGLHDTVTVDVATAAPFALQWWTRRLVLPLPAPLHVSPRCGRPDRPTARVHDDNGDGHEWVPSDMGQPRGAHPYRAGDSRRQVHWRATAHTGELMVRELERPSAEPVTVTVVLPDDPDAAERAAERALGTVVQVLQSGAPVLLTTMEESGPVVAPVTDRRTAGRRLARALGPSLTSSPPAGRTRPTT
jgi:uncharacterized protein (DUF58 family)